MPTAPHATLLLTRPLPDSQRIAAMLPDWPAVIAPILRIEPVPHDAAILQAAPGLVFTSGHAVASAGPGRGRLALCVGPRTGELARAAGFDVREGDGFAESLLPLIATADRPLIHPHGRHLARRLPVPGVVVYDQLPQPLTPQALELLSRPAPVVLPLFSPRSARLLAQAVAGAVAPLWVVAISDAALAAFGAPAARTVVASRPEASALVAAITQIARAEQSG
ncbi:uroporphyrinogen-III synthase [Paracoccus bogoriensis]|uniref:uroporphyrinogen-III synthase n=1 Tax=Paracoccus bogoriensis TaxID=242065 RepID=UPI001C66A5F3|nr:uroporphyrinogen-III synthase [Paracoccus bogoriensis]MBW7057110.1 uroporphyrinogen-III synthase [Paracoccus bogoriensis]